jgi:hypothetical protein
LDYDIETEQGENDEKRTPMVQNQMDDSEEEELREQLQL